MPFVRNPKLFTKELSQHKTPTGAYTTDLTLKELYAGMAMQGIIMAMSLQEGRDFSNSLEAIAVGSWKMAETMLDVRGFA